MEFRREEILPGVFLTALHTDKFKTALLSLSLLTQLDAETKRFVWQTVAALGGILKDETIRRLKPAARLRLPRVRARYGQGKGSEE